MSTFTTVCSIYCANAYAIGETAKKEKKDALLSEKVNRKALKDLNRQSLSWQHKQTQKSFNRMRVLQELKWFHDRGLKPQCISCAKENMDWCCGHHKTVGAEGELRYSEFNTTLQCNRYCNMGLSGNIHGNKTTRGYLQGLKDRFGEVEGQAIIDKCEAHSGQVKWSWQQLEEMRAGFNQKIRELEKAQLEQS